MTMRDHLRMVEDEVQEVVTQEPSSTAYKMLNEVLLVQHYSTTQTPGEVYDGVHSPLERGLHEKQESSGGM